jgi:hypothetical protein
MGVIRKNGKQYDSGDVELSLLGYVESEVTEITYNTEQEHQLNFSLSNEPTSWSAGKKTPTATLGLYMTAVAKIEDKCGGDLLTLQPFDINVTYVNEFNRVVNDTLTVKFKTQGRTVNGEMGLKQTFELFVLAIKFRNE